MDIFWLVVDFSWIFYRLKWIFYQTDLATLAESSQMSLQSESIHQCVRAACVVFRFRRVSNIKMLTVDCAAKSRDADAGFRCPICIKNRIFGKKKSLYVHLRHFLADMAIKTIEELRGNC